jgi:hypothetical protein
MNNMKGWNKKVKKEELETKLNEAVQANEKLKADMEEWMRRLKT